MHAALGEAGSPPLEWPEESLVRRVDTVDPSDLPPSPVPVLRASIEELAIHPDQDVARVSAHALLLSPTHRPDGWGRSRIEEDLRP